MNRASLASFALVSLTFVGCGSASTDSPDDGDTSSDAEDTGSSEGGVDTGRTDTGGETTASDSGDAADSKPCDPTAAPADDRCVLRDDLGVFVSASTGDDANSGTKTKPVKTLKHALELAKSRSVRVYACAEVFDENLALVDGVDVFGGVDCKGGSVAVTGQTTLRPKTSPVITAEGLTKGSRLANMTAEAPTATAEGTSSIAMLVRTSKGLSLQLVTLKAGDAAKGSDGTFGAVGTPGGGGTSGGNSIPCAPYAVSGKGGTLLTSKGGDGGESGCSAFFGAGRAPTNGKSASDSSTVYGVGGPAGSSASSPCDPGTKGAVGSDGAAGAGGGEIGTLTTTYVASNDGTSGSPGTNGTAGGGGGAGYFSTLFSANPDLVVSGGAGGGGGSGGGGGAGSTAGKGGGASIALLSIDSEVALTKCDLVSGRGGTGGVGGSRTIGGAGGRGGAGGMASGRASEGVNDQPGCFGGDGGKGGYGGPAGGGGGGPSFVIAFKGVAPVRTVGTLTLGTAGPGGTGGSGAAAGANGKAVESYEFK